MRGNLAIFIALTISGVLNFSAIALYSRLLSPDEYGAYSVVFVGAALVVSFAFSWLELSFVRFVSSGEFCTSKHVFSNFIILYVVLLFIVASVLILLYFTSLFSMLSASVFLIVVVLIVSEVIFIAVNNHARFVNRALFCYSIAMISRSVLAFFLGWLFVVLGYSYVGILVALACSFIIPTIIVSFKSRIWSDFSITFADYGLIKDICHFGVPLVLVMVIQSAISATDRFLLMGMQGAEVTGQYSASQDLVVKLFIFLLAIVHKVSYPLVINKFENGGMVNARGQLKQHLILLLTIAIPAVFAMSIYAVNIVDVVLGEKFRVVAADLMPYQVVIAFINCLSMFYIVMPFYLMKKTKILVVPGIVALLANLIIGYIAIGLWGIYGAVLGSFVAYSLYFLLSLTLGRRFLELPGPGGDVAKVLFSSALMVSILLLFKWDVGGEGLAGLVVTGLVSYALISLALNIGGSRDLVSEKLRKVKSVKL